MTTNQLRAIELARAILAGAELPSNGPPPELSDADWHLLLLAGGWNNVQAPAAKVARRVLELAGRRAGYFAGVATGAAMIATDLDGGGETAMIAVA